MNISTQIFTTVGLNSSSYIFYNGTVEETGFKITSIVDCITIIWGLPINFYVIWLLVTGTGNGLAAELFSLNLAVCEIFICMETLLIFLSYKFNIIWMAVTFLDGLPTTGRPLFQCLMCVERYLAVVHPVTFLKYKPLRYRAICSVIVWVAALVSCMVSIMTFLLSFTPLYLFFFCIQFFPFLSFQLFCCLAVLRALKQSGPGERGEENHIKRRAFYLILITNVFMMIFYAPFIGLLVVNTLSAHFQAHTITKSISYVCFTMAGLVQPLLFLYRVGKLPFIKY